MILLMKVRGKRKNGDLVLDRNESEYIGEAVVPGYVAEHHAKELLKQFEVGLETVKKAKAS